MATAVKNVAEPRSSSPEARLPFIGLFGAIFLIASIVAVVVGLPYLWTIGVEPLGLRPGISLVLKLAAQIGLAVLLAVFGVALQGSNPTEGSRGAVFFAMSAIISVFFLTRAVGLIVERNWLKELSQRQTGLIVTGVAGLLFAFLGWRFLRSRRVNRWMIGFDRAGWLSAVGFKKTQGQHVRRLTMLGILVLVGSGIYVLWSSNSLGSYDNGFFRGTALQATKSNDWVLALPFTDYLVTLLPIVKFTLPALLTALSLWLPFRVVNYPRFADFLIATEAEMNKVSWTPRAQLFRDTIVVLVTVFLITMFLLVVDVFWGWLLRQPLIGVLPPAAATTKQEAKQVGW